ncbi:acid ase [Fusarium albosuccineum]|uniref:Acid ase n=1 Tax=Fusarium albosuccineum TaxID=1237068 RepID=A0A8H4LMQ7_9HYPO|nr:acid ase [Fusarium albosuccineum]
MMRFNWLLLPLILAFIHGALPAVVKVETAQADWDMTRPLNGFSFERAKALKAKATHHSSPRMSRLKPLATNRQVYPRSALSLLTRPRHTAAGNVATGHFQNISAVGGFSTQYAIQCTWDDTPLWLIFDTGGSDTWATKSGFRCEDNLGNKHDQASCGFGRPFISGFGHEELREVHFHRKYGSGEDISGPMGLSDISCGGVSVYEQQVGLANRTYWHGNNVTVGVLGLAYPSLTSSYLGGPKDETEWNNFPYTPWLTHAIAQGSIDPVFSIAINRNLSDGVLAWGGLPPMDWKYESFAVTDLIVAKLVDREKTAWEPAFYTIIPDGLTWGSTTDTTKYPYIIETGTTMIHVPPQSIARAFQPPAVYLYQWGSYFAPCDSIPPRFAVIISGVRFWINSADLIYKDLVDPVTGHCAIAISSGGPGPYILGDAFLQNVLAVFDVGGAEMRFYSRM